MCHWLISRPINFFKQVTWLLSTKSVKYYMKSHAFIIKCMVKWPCLKFVDIIDNRQPTWMRRVSVLKSQCLLYTVSPMASRSPSSSPSAVSGGGDGLRSMTGECIAVGDEDPSASTSSAPSHLPSRGGSNRVQGVKKTVPQIRVGWYDYIMKRQRFINKYICYFVFTR